MFFTSNAPWVPIRPRAVLVGFACVVLGMGLAALADCGNVSDVPDAPTVWRAS